MALSAALIQSSTTHTPTNRTMSSTITSDGSNNYSSLTASTGGPRTSHFGIYQQTDVTIRTLVPAAISVEHYRKALITKFFFRQILPLADATYVSFSDLMTTVALHFSINTGLSKRESDAAVISIRSNFFRVTNLQGAGFADTSGKIVKVPDPT